MDETDSTALTLCLFETVSVLGLLLFSCDFGHRLTTRFGVINGAFYELDWRTFPYQIKRIMPVVLGQATTS